jgi:hypothetical protein
MGTNPVHFQAPSSEKILLTLISKSSIWGNKDGIGRAGMNLTLNAIGKNTE